MRSSEKNKTKIYYTLRNIRSGMDEWGNAKDVTTYGNPRQMKICVSLNGGETAPDAFGRDFRYDGEMITFDTSCPIDEYTRLWIPEPSLKVEDMKQTVFSEDGTIFIDMRETDKTDPPSIDEESIIDKSAKMVYSENGTIFIDTQNAIVEADENGFSVFGLKAHNYEVAAVIRSLNSIRYEIRRVNVSR